MDLIITQMIRKYGSSAKPWLVRCNNNENDLYIVKFAKENNAFINEYLCYRIAKQIGLTTTCSFPSLIEQEQVEIINHRKKQEKEPLIESGHFFFSKYVKDPFTLEKETHTNLDSASIKNLGQVPGMIAFDIFIENTDRSANNALIHPIDNKNPIFEYVLIDHGHCFGGPGWTSKSLTNLQYNIKTIPWKTTEIHRESDFLPYIAQLKSLDASFFKSVLSEIPDGWKPDSENVDALLSFLINRDSEKVLEAVRNANNNTQRFPNWK